MARRTFARHGADKHFRDFDDNALQLPEHAPETLEFILKWMYQKQLGIAEYCKVIFATNDKSHGGLETAFLLLCRVYILADYLDMRGIMDPVTEDLLETTVAGVEKRYSAIGPDAVKSVWRNTHEGSRLQDFTLQYLSESLVNDTNGRQIEDYMVCFTAIEGFGPMLMRRFLELHRQAKW